MQLKFTLSICMLTFRNSVMTCKTLEVDCSIGILPCWYQRTVHRLNIFETLFACQLFKKEWKKKRNVVLTSLILSDSICLWFLRIELFYVIVFF